MAAKVNPRNLIAAVVLTFIVTAGCLNAQKMSSLQIMTTLRNDVLAQGAEKTFIVGVDISPDASRLAVLYAVATDPKNPPVYDELWLALWDVHAEKLVKRAELAKSDQNSDVFTVGPLDVKFTEDQKYLVVLGLRQVWVVDSHDCLIRTSARADRPDFGFPAQILLVSNSEMAITFVRDSGGPFTTIIYQVPSFAEVVSWTSTNSPQSFSPNALLAVMSDNSYNAGGVSNIVIMNSRTGQVIRTVQVGFAFPKSWIGKRDAHGSVVVRFTKDKELITAPDGCRDSAGHYSGEGVEVINAIDGHLERRIALDSYGPTGTIAESTDRRWIALESIYAKPMWFSVDSANPSHFVHTLRLLETDGSDSQFLVSWPENQTNGASFPAFAVSPRISSVGPTVVITTGNKIDVLSVQK